MPFTLPPRFSMSSPKASARFAVSRKFLTPWSVQLIRLTNVATAFSLPRAGIRPLWQPYACREAIRKAQSGGTKAGFVESGTRVLATRPIPLVRGGSLEDPVDVFHQLAVASTLLGDGRLLVRRAG